MLKLKKSIRVATAVTATLALAPTVTAANAQGQRDPAQLLERSDLDADGRITRSEYAQARASMFDRLDRNGDGKVNEEDAPRRRFARRSGGGEQLRSLAQVMDTNGDGRVTRAEFVDGPTPIFDRADADGDGIVTRNEIAALRSAAQHRPQ